MSWRPGSEDDFKDDIVDDGRWPEFDKPATERRGYVRGDETDVGDFNPVRLGDALGRVVHMAAKSVEIGSNCESPIELMLGAEILASAERHGIKLKLCMMMDLEHQDDSLLLVPQFRWSIYRSDWAILRNRRDASALLIECDGAEFHSSPEQIAHDRQKDAAALEYGHLTLRFAGSYIYRKPQECAEKVLKVVGDQE